ncbi:MFS transporter [Clostridium kluyveri]|uniref:MFS transporter n=1 Tax=Clostridium kluyveri TaxID=1534 RepID=A0A1L5FB62_CLOKL|nr:MFS transporter [Clostridium kluyveri]APM40258.1 MFS transporter [Clostridium kluyveri]
MKKIVFPGIAMIGVTYAFARFSYGLFLPDISNSLKLSEMQAGVPSSLAYIAYCLTLVFSSLLIDRAGAYNTIQISGFSAVIGTLCIALSQNLYMLSISTFIAGIGSGLSSPAFSKIAAVNLKPEERDKGNTWINTGTSFGLIISGPLALFFSNYWRLAYIFFAAISFIVILWNRRSIPKTDLQFKQSDLPIGRKNGWNISWKRSIHLFTAAFITGISSSIYWTFSRSFLKAEYDMSTMESMFFWILMGIAGILGGVAGNFIRQFGLATSYRGVLLVLLASICLITIPSTISIYCSALLFGISYIFITGVFIVWGVKLFVEAPFLGVSLSFLSLGIGQSFGSLTAGSIIDLASYAFGFLLFAGIGLCGLFVRTPTDTSSDS